MDLLSIRIYICKMAVIKTKKTETTDETAKINKNNASNRRSTQARGRGIKSIPNNSIIRCGVERISQATYKDTQLYANMADRRIRLTFL